ncbi:hypothetical protein [Photobacterium kishitanii]|uniref:hypothetical protein n=1 Tax=Photobacterium kishitanii TaxID=318456 RepID=UPI0007F93426|nr:hypothetical protein [Photobacterium kishitanii]OBU31189.1 hypothetical protein AYY23_19960 [Photobacterium kishitanii]PSW46902.1 hypothetical protein C0W66_21185 [Photobacterium kishitanii]
MKYLEIYSRTIVDERGTPLYQFKDNSKTLKQLSHCKKSLLAAVTKFARFRGIIKPTESIDIY